MRARQFDDWSPHRPTRTPAHIPTPTPELWLHYGAKGRANFRTAVAHTRYHIVTLGWAHTGYQGYVIPGQLLLARPPHRMGAHTRGHQGASALCVPGDGRRADVTDRLLDTLAWAAVYGHRQGWWPPQFTGAHRDAPRNQSNTLCCGDPLSEAIPEINRRARRLMAPSKPKPEPEDIVASIDELRDVVREELYERVRPRQNEAVRLAQAACEGTVALHRQTLGLDPDPESDRIWSDRIRDGDDDTTMPDVVAALREKAKG